MHVITKQDTVMRTLQLNLVDAEDENEVVPWSPMLLCAQFAAQRGFVQNGRPDCMKAGTEILERVPLLNLKRETIVTEQCTPSALQQYMYVAEKLRGHYLCLFTPCHPAHSHGRGKMDGTLRRLHSFINLAVVHPLPYESVIYL